MQKVHKFYISVTTWLAMGQKYNEKIFPVHTPSIHWWMLPHFGLKSLLALPTTARILNLDSL
jgi:hypothetical protein